MPLDNAPDLTQRAPRSPRVRLGGYTILPRMLDKGRATLAGKNGEFNYNCPLDERFENFAALTRKRSWINSRPAKATVKSSSGFKARPRTSARKRKSTPGPRSRSNEFRPISNHASISTNSRPKSRPSARMWEAGLNCWTLTITSPSAARFNGIPPLPKGEGGVRGKETVSVTKAQSLSSAEAFVLG